MNITLLKSKTDKANITTQQEGIIKYAKTHSMKLDNTEIEGSDTSLALEERTEFKGFLRSLSFGDTLLIYDLWVLSSDMGELTKILECLLQRDISICISSENAHIDKDTTPLEVLTILSKYREKNLIKKQENIQGRPKGRMSKSKFDPYRAQIIDDLSLGYSVSKIARILEVSRTSLKDYINSRGLKELVEAKKSLLEEKQSKKKTKQKNTKKEECSLIKGK
jgi:DNA invertase Pin-like site-specific DNA recombinase